MEGKLGPLRRRHPADDASDDDYHHHHPTSSSAPSDEWTEVEGSKHADPFLPASDDDDDDSNELAAGHESLVADIVQMGVASSVARAAVLETAALYGSSKQAADEAIILALDRTDSLKDQAARAAQAAASPSPSPSPSPSSEPYMFSVEYAPGAIGIGFVPVKGLNDEPLGVKVASVKEGGPSAADGRIQRGDRIVGVNNIDISDVDKDEAMGAVRQCVSAPFTLTFLRPPAALQDRYGGDDVDDDDDEEDDMTFLFVMFGIALVLVMFGGCIFFLQQNGSLEGIGGDLFGTFGGTFGGGGGGGGRGQRYKARDRDLDANVDLKLTLAQLYTGATVKKQFRRQTLCVSCEGTGAAKGFGQVRCPRCNGQGAQIYRTQMGNFRQECDHCKGQGTVVERPCGRCRGKKVYAETAHVEAEVPPGSSHGDQVRCRGGREEREGERARGRESERARERESESGGGGSCISRRLSAKPVRE